jgi:hypothetical protein
MNPIGMLVSLLVFVIVVVIIVLIIKWGLAKAGIALDPMLMNIIYLILFLVLLLAFLNWTGIWVWGSGPGFHR